MTSTKTISAIILKLVNYAQTLDWSADIDEESVMVTFGKYSPAGQDFSFDVCLEQTDDEQEQAELFIDSIKAYYEGYDPSQEAYYWLDETGHGKNGAPYEMVDVYNDMVCCEEMIYELWTNLHDFYYSEMYCEDE